jgi:hypothetical protein
LRTTSSGRRSMSKRAYQHADAVTVGLRPPARAKGSEADVGSGRRPTVHVRHRGPTSRISAKAYALHPHDRPSQALGRARPRLLGGGAAPNQENPNLCDGIRPRRSRFDEAQDYSTNEVATNWNAALVYALAFVRSGSR